ncbi:MAG: hypothetical protein ABGW78_08235 [Pirellulales bacterium]
MGGTNVSTTTGAEWLVSGLSIQNTHSETTPPGKYFMRQLAKTRRKKLGIDHMGRQPFGVSGTCCGYEEPDQGSKQNVGRAVLFRKGIF